MYRCALVGVGGPRAHGHAEAYELVKRGTLVAVSTRRAELAAAFADRYRVPAHYTDYRELLAAQDVDVLHVVTPPDTRLEILEAAEAAGVAAVVLEKPIAIDWEDYQALVDFSRRATCKVVVNHQLHFHRRMAELRDRVLSGGLGTPLLVDASARHNLAYQGSHIVQAAHALTGWAALTSAFAQIGGPAGLADDGGRHYAPEFCLAEIEFAGAPRVLLRSGLNAPAAGDFDERHLHKRVAVWGERGWAEWSMSGWRVGIEGRVDGGALDYWEADRQAQADLVEATFDWIEAPQRPHPCRLDLALEQFTILGAVLESGLRREVVRAPVPRSPRLVSQLTEALAR